MVTYQSQNVDCPPGSTIHFTIIATFNSSYPIGPVTSSFALIADQYSLSIPFQMTIVSDDSVSIIINLRDEFTVFSENHPPVENATVIIRNAARNIYLRKISDKIGQLFFDGLTEDYYEIETYSGKHLSTKQITLIDKINYPLSIFMQRISVKYDFSVKRIDVEDKYDITIETSFVAVS